MAKIMFGMYMTDARGKQGGHVFSKNRAGAYVRTKVTPTNPRTIYQSAQRGLLTALSQAWRTLSQVERNAWNAAVVNFERTDVFGNLRRPTGKNLYTLINSNLINSGNAEVSLPPTPTEQALIFNLVSTGAAGTPALTIAADMSQFAGSEIFIWATPQLSAGVGNPNANFRLLTVAPAVALFSESILAAYVARFGSLVAGQKVFIGLQPVTSTGQAGVRQTSELIVAV